MAKRLKIKLPKRIAGVKIPKAVRKGPFADFLNSSAGQALIAQALIAAAGAFALKGADRDSKPGDLFRDSVDSAKRVAQGAARRAEPSRLSFALNEGVNAFRAALEQDTGPQESEPVNVEMERVAKKKQPAQKEVSSTPH